MAKKYFRIDLFVDASCVLNTKRKKVVVDTYAAGVRFDAGETYTVEYEAGFVKGTENNEFLSPATTGGTFTTNTTGPAVQTFEPADGGTNITNNTFIRYTYDRNILAGNGNYNLYKVGSPDSLIATYNPSDSTANNLISGNQITLVTTGLIDANETYYVLIDAGAVEDKDGLPTPAFSSTTDHRWTTAQSTNVDFPDLISLQASSGTLTCSATKNPNYEYLGSESFSSAITFALSGDPVFKGINNMIAARDYDRDTDNQIFQYQTPYIEEGEASGDNYTIEFSATGGEFGDTNNPNTSSSTFSFTGSITDANALFDKILYYPPNGITGGTSYTMTYTQKRAGVTQLTRTVALNNTNNDIDNTVSYVYLESNQTYAPSRTLQLYKAFHFLVVGGGGGGAGHSNALGGGGGGGGEVIYSVHEGISNPTTFSSVSQLNITIGSGGSLGTTDAGASNPPTNATDGTAGGTTSMVINYSNSTSTTYSASGGGAGTISDGGDDGAGRYSGYAGSTVSSRVYGGGGAGAGDLWYNTNGSRGDAFGVGGNGGGLGFNASNYTGWGDDFLYGQGGDGSDANGSGFVKTGEKTVNSGASNYNYLGSGGTFQLTTANSTMRQRGQGGTGSGRNYTTAQTVVGTVGQAGVVALKIF